MSAADWMPYLALTLSAGLLWLGFRGLREDPDEAAGLSGKAVLLARIDEFLATGSRLRGHRAFVGEHDVAELQSIVEQLIAIKYAADQKGRWHLVFSMKPREAAGQKAPRPAQ